MINRTLIALTMVAALVTGSVNASFNVSNHGTQPIKVDFDYTQNNIWQTSPRLEVGPNSTIVWDAPGQGQACLTALRVNDMPHPIYTLENLPNFSPSCMISADIHIWPAGNVTLQGVTQGKMVPR